MTLVEKSLPFLINENACSSGKGEPLCSIPGGVALIRSVF